MLNVRQFRVGAVLWLVLWMLVIPLIHVHPDADQHHGIAGHDHGGVFHTVYSQDLEGEYAHHSPEHDASVIQRPVLPFLGDLAGLLSHPEIGFSFLSSSPDHPLVKQILTNVVLAELDLTLLTYPCSIAYRELSPAPSLVLLANDLAARAPPVTSV